MPGPSLTETRTWETVTAPPADGDDLAIATGTAPLRPNVLQKLYSRESYLFNGPFHGFVDPAYQAEITASGTTRTWVLRTAKRIALERADGTIDVFTVGGVALSIVIGALAANQEAFVYAYNNAGTLALEVSSTLPEPSLDFKDSDPTRVYLGSFITDDAGRAITQVQCGRRYVLIGQSITGDTKCGETLANGETLVPALAPSTARMGTFRFRSTVNAAPTATRIALIYAKGGGLAHQHYWRNADARNDQETVLELALVDAQIALSTGVVAEIIGEARLAGWVE